MKKHFSFSPPAIELIGKIMAFIVIILMTHLLSIEDMGKYSIVISVVMISSVFMDGGVNNKIYTLILQDIDSKLSDYYSQKIIFSFFTVVSITIYAYFTYSFWIDILLYILMTFFVSQIILYKFIYRASQNRKWDIITILIDPLSKLLTISIIYFAKNNISLWSVLLAFLIVSIVEYIVVNRYFKNHYKNFHYIQPTLKKFIEIFNEIKYFIFFYFLYILYQRIDIFFIEKFLSSDDVAIYFSAYNIYMAVIIFITALVSFSFPKIKKFSLKEQLLYFKRYFVLLPIALLFTYYTLPNIYPIIYPKNYSSGANILFWLLGATPFVFITYLIIFNLNFLKQEKASIFPILFILIFKIFIFNFAMTYFDTTVVFAQSYIIFEFLLSVLFLIMFQKNKQKGINE